jgi:hypothetical protein
MESCQMRTTNRLALLVLALAFVVAACAGGTSPSPAPTDPPASAPPSATPLPSPIGEQVIVTIRVVDLEEFKVLLTDPADIAIAYDLLAGKEAPGIPNGKIIKGSDGGFNTGWNWHLDPNDFEWADMAMEICDGRPSDVEDVITSDRYCTWAGKVVKIEAAA